MRQRFQEFEQEYFEKKVRGVIAHPLFRVLPLGDEGVWVGGIKELIWAEGG